MDRARPFEAAVILEAHTTVVKGVNAAARPHVDEWRGNRIGRPLRCAILRSTQRRYGTKRMREKNGGSISILGGFSARLCGLAREKTVRVKTREKDLGTPAPRRSRADPFFARLLCLLNESPLNAHVFYMNFAENNSRSA